MIRCGYNSAMSKHTEIEIIARGLLINQGRVLMCRNIKSGYCFLPGGHVEFSEQAQDALIREFQEETGLSSEVGPLILTTEQCFHDGKRIHHEINLVFHVEQLGLAKLPPESVPSMEKKIDFVWIDLGELSETDIRPNDIKAWLMSGGQTADDQGKWLSGFESTL